MWVTLHNAVLLRPRVVCFVNYTIELQLASGMELEFQNRRDWDIVSNWSGTLSKIAQKLIECYLII